MVNNAKGPKIKGNFQFFLLCKNSRNYNVHDFTNAHAPLLDQIQNLTLAWLKVKEDKEEIRRKLSSYLLISSITA